MEAIILVFLFFPLAIVAVLSVIKIFNSRIKNHRYLKEASVILCLSSLSVLADILARDYPKAPFTMALDLLPAIISMWFLNISVQNILKPAKIILFFGLFQAAVLMYNTSRVFGLAESPSQAEIKNILLILAAIFFILTLVPYSLFIRDAKAFMKNATIWMNVCLIVEMVYLVFIVISLILIYCGLLIPGFVLMTGVLCGMGTKILNDSQFIIWRRHENALLESMKVASVPPVMQENQIEEMYKSIYERIMMVFESEKPFLDPNLTINILAQTLYTNKLYVSKAIHYYTGRNFRQFLNCHRVMYSLELFRGNPDLRVYELSSMSGFNNLVTYTMTFKEHLHETPSDWCRMERAKLVKKKK